MQPVRVVSGAEIHAISAAAIRTSAARSSGSNAAGVLAPACRLTSQLRVKLGMIRPPTRLMSISRVAMPSRLPAFAAAAQPSASAWTRALPVSSNRSAASIGRLRQLRPATISRATTRRNASGKARSTAVAAPAPISPPNRVAARPAAHSSASAASGMPCSGSLPVQFGIAVSRKPATVAAPKPKTISWTCQTAGGSADGSAASPANATSQSGMAIAAQSADARKKGRNPADSRTGPGWER